MVSIMEIMQLCRLCLVKEQVNVPIFDEQGDIRQICLKITACLPVKVSKEDKLPKKICDGCLYKLELLYQFYNTTANAEKQLLSWIEQAKMDSKNVAGELTTQPQATVKQEKLEPVESTNETPELSSEAQSYILQQQQLQYQSDFPFKESQGSNTDGVASNTSVNSDEPIAKRPRRRRQATKPIPPEAIDSSDDNDAGDSMMEMTVTKTEEESESDGDDNADDPEPEKYVAVGDDTDQPGPSGLGKGSTDTPSLSRRFKPVLNPKEVAATSIEHSQSRRSTRNSSKTKEMEKNSINPKTSNSESALQPGEIKVELVDVEATEVITETFVRENASKKGKRNPSKKLTDEQLAMDVKVLCDICGKSLASIERLKFHRRTHTGDKPFVCTFCGKGFSRKEQLKEHERVHTGEKPYICSFCGKGFTQRTSMKTHERTHTGEKPYGCRFCSKQFISKGVMDNHMKNCQGW